MALTGLQKQMERLRNSTPDRAKNPQTDEEWLIWIEAKKEAGRFRHEPDYEIAITELKEAIAAFPTAKRNHPIISRDRTPGHYLMMLNRIHLALGWLIRMYNREIAGFKGVSEKEYEELKGWYYREVKNTENEIFVNQDVKLERDYAPILLSEAVRKSARESKYAVNTVLKLREMKADWEARQTAKSIGESNEANVPETQ